MATLNPPQKISRRHELRQDQVVTGYARAWDFVDKNRTLVWGVIGAIVLLVVLAVAYVFYQQNQEAKAQGALAVPIRLYEQDNYREALDGADGAMGFLAIADEYGGTDAGNLAHFYAADALFNLGEYDQALDHFEDFDKEETTSARARWRAKPLSTRTRVPTSAPGSCISAPPPSSRAS